MMEFKSWLGMMLVVLSFLLTDSLFTSTDSAADSTSVAAQFPDNWGRQRGASVFTGTDTYYFGGTYTRCCDLGGGADTIAMSHIYRFSPAVGIDIVATLPEALFGMSAVWTGQYAFLFGGCSGTTPHERNWCYNSPPSDTIYRFDPATNEVTVMNAKLPSERTGTSAIWSGQYAYIFGGLGLNLTVENTLNDSGIPLAEIVRYDPIDDAVTVMNASLPTPRSDTSAAFDGSNAFIFGGEKGRSQGNYSDIIRYSIESDSVQVMSAALNGHISGSSAIWNGTSFFVFGGYLQQFPNYQTCGGGCFSPSILRYDPQKDRITEMGARLSRRAWTSAIWDGSHAYVLGGSYSKADISEVARYSLVPGAPNDPIATSGPAYGEITLTWSPPPYYTYDVITGHHVYRGTSPDSLSAVAEVGTDLVFQDRELSADTYYYAVSALSPYGEGGKSVVVTGSPPTPFSLAIDPPSLTTLSGTTTTVTATVSIHRVPGYGSAVTLTASRGPGNAIVDFSPNPSGTSAVMTVTTFPTTEAGVYAMTITGSDGDVDISVKETLVVDIERRVTRSYLLQDYDWLGVPCSTWTYTCFPITANDRSIKSIVLKDAVSPGAAFYWEIIGDLPDCTNFSCWQTTMASGWGCGTITNIPIPPGINRTLRIALDRYLPFYTCGPLYASPTTGTIDVIFSQIAPRLRGDSLSYIGGGEFSFSCSPRYGLAGGACFSIHAGEVSVQSITAKDTVAETVGLGWWFLDTNLRIISSGHSCGPISDLPIPSNAATIQIMVDDLNALSQCQLTTQPATQGILLITFRLN